MIRLQDFIIGLVIVAFAATEFVVSWPDASASSGSTSNAGSIFNAGSTTSISIAGNVAICIFEPQEVERLFSTYRNLVEEREELESKLAAEGKVLNSNDKSADLSLLSQIVHEQTNRERELKQIPFEAVTESLVKKYQLTPTTVNECLPNASLSGEYSSKAKSACLQSRPVVRQCDPDAVYRTADGTCNNIENPTWGSSGSCFQRLLPPNYEGVSSLRRSLDRGPLPDPRTLSLNIHSHLDRPSYQANHMHAFFGTMVVHDITQSPISITVGGQRIQCCGVAGPLHPQCAPIPISPQDPFYAQFGKTCLNFVRTVPCPTCSLGYRQQTNAITAFIDGSFLYGNSESETFLLRTNDNTGRMRTQVSLYGDLLPRSPDPESDRCSYAETKDFCFQSGDSRVNQQSTIASLHTIFLRQHNRLAESVRTINPHWIGERIFQEVRKILGAWMQVIVYKEYLPLTLGEGAIAKFQLGLSEGRSTYNDSINPNLYNEVTTAAFRFGHSQMNSVVANSPLNSTGGVRLLRARGEASGLDVAAVNIQRGRDHGMPTYTEMVAHCSKISVTDFWDLVPLGLMSADTVFLLSHNYRYVYDIDLWTGIVSEIASPGAIVGPTATCILGLQFHNLKFGDRFYFEHGKQAGSFTDRQVTELKRMSLSSIICLNTDVKKLPENAMAFSSSYNKLINCSSVEEINLSYWKE